MNLIELDRALKQLPLGGMAAVLESVEPFADLSPLNYLRLKVTPIRYQHCDATLCVYSHGDLCADHVKRPELWHAGNVRRCRRSLGLS